MKGHRGLLALIAALMFVLGLVMLRPWSHSAAVKPPSITYPGCSTQLADWTGITAELNPIYQQERLIRYYRQGGVISTWKSNYDAQRRAWFQLAGYAMAGLRNRPPQCLPGIRQSWSTAMTDFMAAAESWSQHTAEGDNFAGWQLQGADDALQVLLRDMSVITQPSMYA